MKEIGDAVWYGPVEKDRFIDRQSAFRLRFFYEDLPFKSQRVESDFRKRQAAGPLIIDEGSGRFGNDPEPLLFQCVNDRGFSRTGGTGDDTPASLPVRSFTGFSVEMQ